MEDGLNQTVPRLGKTPVITESWCPPFVSARRVCPLCLMSVSMEGLLNTEIVDCESSRIHAGSIVEEAACAIIKAYWVSVVPVAEEVLVGQLAA